VKTRDDEGIFQLAIEGANLGDLQNEYSSTAGYELRDLDAVTFDTSGQKAFQFSLTGRDPSSRGYTLGLDYIDLQPAAESGAAVAVRDGKLRDDRPGDWHDGSARGATAMIVGTLQRYFGLRFLAAEWHHVR
jgi:hypothetical protein